MKIDREITSLRGRSNTDPTLGHAIYYGMGVALIALCVVLGLLVLGKAFLQIEIPRDVFWIILASPLLGIGAGGFKLLAFVGEYREWLYHLEDALNLDLDNDGKIGEPPSSKERAPGSGSLVRGVDGALHRIYTELSIEEMRGVKKHLLTTDGFTVRAMNDLLQDDSRASALREELWALGILTKPKPRTVSKLTPAGKKAVMRWA